MAADKPAQAVIAPFATLLTTFLWLETWVEILSRGARHSPDDLSKLYLAVMAAYAGASEITKWLNSYPTDPAEDPRFERIQRGGFFIGLWLAPLLFAYGWRITDPNVPMPAPLEKITMGLVGIFFLKAASRRIRHKKHGVIDPATGQLKQDPDDDAPGQSDLSDAVYKHIASRPDGMSVVDIQSAFPEVSRPRLYRAFDELMQAKRLTRTGKPRTPEVRYQVM
jgi:hypothetical protein